MNRKTILPIPEAIVQLQRQLDQFRSTQPPRTKLPESLWQAAIELARQYGIYPSRTRCGCKYMGLKKTRRPDGCGASRPPRCLPASSWRTCSSGSTSSTRA